MGRIGEKAAGILGIVAGLVIVLISIDVVFNGAVTGMFFQVEEESVTDE